MNEVSPGMYDAKFLNIGYIYLCMCISVRLCACRCVPAPICAHMYLYVCVLCRHVCSCVHLLVYMEAFGLKPGGRGIVTGC